MTKKKYYETDEFHDLQTQWYEKLKTKGFKDLEFYDTKTGRGQNSPFLKHSLHSLRSSISDDKIVYYRILDNFLSYNPPKLKIYRHLLAFHAQGLTMREISRRMRRYINQYTPKFSVFWVHYHVSRLVKEAMLWNKTSPDGLLSDRNFDDLFNSSNIDWEKE